MRRPGSVLLFAALSLALHLAWVVWTPEGQRPSPAEPQWVELSFDDEAPAEIQVAEQTPPVESAQPELGAASVQPLATKQKSARPRATSSGEPAREPLQRDPRQTATPPVQLAPTQPSEAPLAVAEPAAPSGASTKRDLLPRTAALSLDAFAHGSAFRCGERTNECAPTQAEIGQAAQGALTRDLNAVANNVPHLKPREHPVLKRRSDGSYSYENGVFQAVVRPDGKVEFRDTSIRPELRPSFIPFVVVADLNDVVERDVLGRELYSAEKQWLLDETRELREKLATDARRRELLDANRALERTLHGILDDQALSVAQKHEAVFLLWQDCGEDAEAHAHRRAVDSFVKRYMPKDSALGFGAAELARFNSARLKLQRFEPYTES